MQNKACTKSSQNVNICVGDHVYYYHEIFLGECGIKIAIMTKNKTNQNGSQNKCFISVRFFGSDYLSQ